MDDAAYVQHFQEWISTSGIGVTDSFAPQHSYRHLSEKEPGGGSKDEEGSLSSENLHAEEGGVNVQFELELERLESISDEKRPEGAGLDRSTSMMKYTPREYGDLPANQSEVSFDEG